MMTNRKFLTISLVSALLAGSIAFDACNDKKDLTPADDGKNLAGEWCDCFAKAGNDDSKKLLCFNDLESKANKWKVEADAAAFKTAFDGAVACTTPDQWYYASYMGNQAIADFCTFFTDHPEAADMEAGMGLMMAPGGLYGQYADLFYNEVFMGSVLAGLLQTCTSVPDWYYCSFGMTDFCPDLEALGIHAAETLCGCLAEATGEEDVTNCLYGLAGYFGNLQDPVFAEAFYGKVVESCPDAIPMIEALLSGGSQ